MDYPAESPSTDTPGLPEVIVDGHKVAAGGREAMSEVYELINMANLAKLRKNAEDRTSQGWSQGYTFVVTDTQTPPEGFFLSHKAQSISLRNDGANPVFVGLNDQENPSQVNATEVINVDFEAHKLEVIYLRCGPGLTSAVRFTVKG